ncbi:MAG: lysophospholipid acyltransferase family protein [Candidatus Binatia bacterium]
MSPGGEVTAAAVREPARARVVVNRLLFRAMLFSSGAVAIGLYHLSPPLAWRFAKVQARNLMRLCGVRVRTRGLERLGKGPYIFTPNHQSHFDIAALLGLLPGVTRFAAKQEMFAEPILGSVLRTMGMIPIDRDDPLTAIERLNRARLEGGSLVIFPEGTRSRDGTLLPFRKGAFVAAIHLGVPVVPVVCKGTTQIMPKGKYLSILPGTAELVILDPIPTAGLTFEDRTSLRDLVRSRIQAELARSIGS